MSASTGVALAAPVDDRPLGAAVREAVATVMDPEYPDVSIVDLGLVESIRTVGDQVQIALVPTFSGCPALSMIADDVKLAVEAIAGVSRCRVEWRAAPVWTPERMSEVARRRLAADYTVVLRSADGSLRCPVCGSRDVQDQSMAGPTRCRSVAWCDACRNPVEVMRA